MGKPNQLTIEQVKSIKKNNNGEPIAIEKINIDGTGKFSKTYKINENDVVFFNFIKQ